MRPTAAAFVNLCKFPEFDVNSTSAQYQTDRGGAGLKICRRVDELAALKLAFLLGRAHFNRSQRSSLLPLARHEPNQQANQYWTYLFANTICIDLIGCACVDLHPRYGELLIPTIDGSTLIIDSNL
jgi:hypothetical protein